MWFASYPDGALRGERRQGFYDKSPFISLPLSPALIESLGGDVKAGQLLSGLGGGCTKSSRRSMSCVPRCLVKLSDQDAWYYDGPLKAAGPLIDVQMTYHGRPLDAYTLRIESVAVLSTYLELRHRWTNKQKTGGTSSYLTPSHPMCRAVWEDKPLPFEGGISFHDLLHRWDAAGHTDSKMGSFNLESSWWLPSSSTSSN